MTNVRGDVSQIEYDLDSLNKMISGLVSYFLFIKRIRIFNYMSCFMIFIFLIVEWKDNDIGRKTRYD